MPRRAIKSSNSTLNAAAEQIGTALGHFAARLDALHQQRDQLATELKRYISGAQAMLKAVHGGRPGQPNRAVGPAATAPNTPRRGRPPGFKMSEAAKQKMRDAWKRRRKQMKIGARGIGKKATHAKKPIVKPLTERAG